MELIDTKNDVFYGQNVANQELSLLRRFPAIFYPI